MVSFLIPQKSVQEILKLINKDESVKFCFSKNQLAVNFDNIHFISRLTDGVFPDYEQIIPKNFKLSLIAKKSEVLSNLKLANVFVGKLSDINIVFSGIKKTLNFQASNQDTGEYLSEIAVNGDGEDVNVKCKVFNRRNISN
jgi:DNA polymerase-3 subunit beta